eukprot:8837684-Pyramimonas_sp.AAC.1
MKTLRINPPVLKGRMSGIPTGLGLCVPSNRTEDESFSYYYIRLPPPTKIDKHRLDKSPPLFSWLMHANHFDPIRTLKVYRQYRQYRIEGVSILSIHLQGHDGVEMVGVQPR